MSETDCIFCKIAKGEIPTEAVYEDDNVIAFKDLNPKMPVHVLIIPKEHYENLSDDVPEEVLGHVFGAASKVAAITGIDKSGYRIVSNAGADACQSVMHLHVHVIGGEPMGEDL